MKKISRKKLRRRCVQPIHKIFQDCVKMGGTIHGNLFDQHAFIDRGSKILVVAHADTVFPNCTKYWGGIKRVYSPNLDDRLGVYLALDYLPVLGINVDVLITENEEMGQSTAKNFTTDKKYNWIVGLDRRGTECVTYDYDSEDWESALRDYFDIEYGKVSDISDMQDLKVSAFNLGIGYHSAHSKKCYCKLSELYEQLKTFKKFYFKNYNNFFSHSPRVIPYYPQRHWGEYGRDYIAPIPLNREYMEQDEADFPYFCSRGCRAVLDEDEVIEEDRVLLCCHCGQEVSKNNSFATICTAEGNFVFWCKECEKCLTDNELDLYNAIERCGICGNIPDLLHESEVGEEDLASPQEHLENFG